MEPGPLNAITDVAGVKVGHTTLISGEGPLRPGDGPVRTGVTVIVPHDGDIWTEPVFAGAHRLNGNGELTGLEWIREAGMLAGAIGITNTHSVGVVHDAIIEAAARAHALSDAVWALPVAGETYDGALNDINGFHVRPEHVHAALAGARGGRVDEGNVGGGTGMICHEFKGGIGTSSRLAAEWTVGVLVQANYGARELLRIDGVPVGAAITRDEVPSPWDEVDALSAAWGCGGWVDHRHRGDRRAAAPPPVHAAGAAGRDGGGAHGQLRLTRLGRPVLRLRHRESRPVAERGRGRSAPDGRTAHGQGPADQSPARGRRRGHRGGDRQCARRRRDDGRPRWDHGLRPRPRSASNGHARARALL